MGGNWRRAEVGFPVAQVFLTLRKAADAKKDIDSFSKAERAVRQLTVACPCDLCRPPTHRLPVIDLPLGPVPPMLPEARPPRNASAPPFTVSGTACWLRRQLASCPS